MLISATQLCSSNATRMLPFANKGEAMASDSKRLPGSITIAGGTRL
jgi:hypothetical protein